MIRGCGANYENRIVVDRHPPVFRDYPAAMARWEIAMA